MLPEQDAKAIKQFGEDMKGFIDDMINAIIEEDADKLQECVNLLANAFENLPNADMTFSESVDYLDDLVDDFKEMKAEKEEGD